VSKNLQLQVKLRDLARSEEALARLASENISARMSYTLALVLHQVTPHLDAKRKAHRKLLERYGKANEKNPEVFAVSTANRDAFEKEFEELLEANVTLTGIGRVRVSALETEGVKMTGGEMFVLNWLLKNDVAALFEEEEKSD